MSLEAPLVPLAPYEEDLLYRQLGAKLQCAKRRLKGQKSEKAEDQKTKDSLLAARRMYRKLAVRKLRRRNGVKVFDLDQEVKDFLHSAVLKEMGGDKAETAQPSNERVLDRYQVKFYFIVSVLKITLF